MFLVFKWLVFRSPLFLRLANNSAKIVENLEKKSVKELKLIAKEKGIKNYSTMLKNDLLKLIKSHTI